MEGTTKMRAELTHALSDLEDPHRTTSATTWFSWLQMDIEERAERKKREKETSVLDSLPKSMRVPKKYMPTFMSLLVTGILVTMHLLVLLLQVWSVKVNLWMNYIGVKGEEVEVPEEWLELEDDRETSRNPLLRPVPKTVGGTDSGDGKMGASAAGGREEHSAKHLLERIEYNNANMGNFPKHLPTHACITPTKAGESKLLVPLLYMPTLGITMEYHRRRYYLDFEGMIWTKIRCNTTMPLPFFKEWSGMTNEQHMEAAGIRFGENKFDVRQLGIYSVHDLDV